MSQLMLKDNQTSSTFEKETINICKPLFDKSSFKKYQINLFTYGRYYNDGSLYFLSTHKVICQHHHKKKYELIPPIEESFFNKNIRYLPSINAQNNKFNQALHDFQSYFNLYHPLFLIEKTNCYLDIYIFSAQTKNFEVINVYNNYYDAFEKFKSYFKSAANTLIEKSCQHKIIVPSEMKKSCSVIAENKFSDDTINLLHPFTASRHVLSDKFERRYITQSEAKILIHVAKGYTAKEIANLLNIAPKTIDVHLTNIKNRLKIKKKYEIFEVASEISAYF